MEHPVLGLKLEYLEPNPGAVMFIVTAKVAMGIKSRDFITSPKIREALTRDSHQYLHNFGQFAIVHDPANKELCYLSYYPHPPTMDERPGLFKKLGIGTALETRLAQLAVERFPDATHVTHANMSRYRMEQLLKRGHDPSTLHRIEKSEYIKKLRLKRAEHMWKDRADAKKKPHHHHAK